MTGSLDVLRAWSDENLLASFDLLVRNPPDSAARASRQFGSVRAFPTGRQSGFYNAVVVLGPAAGRDIETAAGWIRDLGMAVSLRVREDQDGDAVRRAAERLGLVRSAWVDPAMVMEPLREQPSLPPGVRIETTAADTIERWYEALAAGAGVPVTHPFLRELLPPDAIADPEIRLFTGYLGDAPVATSIAIRSENAVGVYAVGTADSARRRGIGSAMTWAAVDAGRGWGSRVAVLQASAMGEPIYRSMGFRTVTGYVSYDEPRPARSPDPAA